MTTQTGSISFESAGGLQSYAKQNYATLSQIKGQFATCGTGASTAAKVATIVPTNSNWTLYEGATVTVKFTSENTTTAPTLNVNSTGAKPIKDYAGNALTSAAYNWPEGAAMALTYDGSSWRIQDSNLMERVYGAETAIDQTATSITSLASMQDTYTKPDGTSGTNSMKTYVDQTAEGINTTISSMQTDISGKADGSTVTTLSNTVNNISDTVSGHTQSISSINSTLTTKSDKSTTITETIQLWYSKANTTAPNKPSAQVTSTSTDGNAWRMVVPAYNASYPNYFYCYQWKYADGNYGWSAVTHDIAMGETQERARTAITNAATAQTTANANIKSSVMLWFTKADMVAPNKPTAQVTTSNASTSNAWNLVVPTYNSSYPYYFYCYQQQKGDNSYQWSDVIYDRATTESQDTARAASSSLANYITTNNATLQSLQNQVDGQIEAWYMSVDPTTSNEPASSWITDTLKTRHEGDLYYNITNGHSWRWLENNGTYSWQQIPDSDAAAALAAAQNAQSTANGKRRIFTAQPTTPYDKGDLWVDGSQVKYATVARSTGSYTAADWDQTATDDTAANAAQATADKNVKESIQLWFTKANTTAPAKPTIAVSNNSPTGANSYNQWNIAVPVYNTSYPYYFYCYQWKLADDTYTWSNVVYDQATTENQANSRAAKTLAESTQTDYAEFKQTMTTFQSTVGTTYATKSTVDGIESRVSTAESTITQHATDIEAKVSKDGVIATINLSTEQENGSNVKISADKVNIEGAAIFSSGRLSTTSLNDTYATNSTVNTANATEEILYYASSSTTAPAVPTSAVSTNSATTYGAWNLTLPTYSSSYPYLFTCLQRKSIGNTYSWTKVTQSSYAQWVNSINTTASNAATTAGNAAPKSDAVSRTQRIYYRQTAAGAKPGINETWLVTSGTGYGNWSLTVPQLTSGSTKYPKLYTAVQTQTVAQQAAGSACSCSPVQLDDSTTVIDGGNIITGTVDANKLNANNINASNILTIGAFNSNTQNDILNSEVMNELVSRGEQLVINGNAFMGDNTNFSSLTFDGSESNCSPGSFTKSISSVTITSDKLFPVDASKTYVAEFDVKAASPGAQMYGMLMFYDVDKRNINVQMVSYFPGSTTTLAQELKNGDTTIYLTNASGFTDTSSTPTHQQALIFWNYTNSFGYTYPPETYSRYYYNNLWNAGGVNKTNNTITLKTAWTRGTFPAGTSVSQNSSGGTYSYFWSHTGISTFPRDWNHVGGLYSGISTSNPNPQSRAFWPGTAYCKIGWLWNYQVSNNNQGQIWITNISVREKRITSSETIEQTQQIYYRSSSSSAPSGTGLPTTWITATTDLFATTNTDASKWSLKASRLTANADGSGTKYPYLWTCTQKKTLDGTVSYGTIALDDTTTVIDGGSIITNSITANQIAANAISIGKLASDVQSDITDAKKHTQVIVSASGINYTATGSTTAATLTATLYIDGIATTSGVTYQWSKDGTAISSNGTSRTLTVTGTMGLSHLYTCTCAWT